MLFIKILYGRASQACADHGCQFFHPPSNELVLRKAVRGTLTPKKKEEKRKEKKERQIGEERTNKNKRKREARFIRIMENVASL